MPNSVMRAKMVPTLVFKQHIVIYIIYHDFLYLEINCQQ
jgi:hypothetical protein